jgi:hypothetical protein
MICRWRSELRRLGNGPQCSASRRRRGGCRHRPRSGHACPSTRCWSSSPFGDTVVTLSLCMAVGFVDFWPRCPPTSWSGCGWSTCSLPPLGSRRRNGHYELVYAAWRRRWACRLLPRLSYGKYSRPMGGSWLYWGCLGCRLGSGFVEVGAVDYMCAHFGRPLLGRRWNGLNFS